MASVAVIGAGPQGLTALKNLREEGFDAICFEKRDCIGGVWQFSEDHNITTVLRTTLGNVSKYQNCFTDLPVPQDSPTYMNAQQYLDYLHSYANHFGLIPHVRLGVAVTKVVRAPDGHKWRLTLQNDEKSWSQDSDKIAICTGTNQRSSLPVIEGLRNSKIEILHSQNYKGPRKFQDKTVVVVGLSNSAGDTASDLVGNAREVYISFRHGNTIVTRWVNGTPLDQYSNRRLNSVRDGINAVAPTVSRALFKYAVRKLAKSSFEIDPAWKMEPVPSAYTHIPMITDKFVDHLARQTVVPVGEIKRFLGAHSVEFTNGTVVEGVDSVIFCTGYKPDYSILPAELQPFGSFSAEQPSETTLKLPQLYQNIFPPDHADSIAFFTFYSLGQGIFHVADIMGMAVAQVWKRGFVLPAPEQMYHSIYVHRIWVETIIAEDKQTSVSSAYLSKVIDQGPWMRWLYDAAGTSVNVNLGYGLQGWLFWLQNPGWCGLLMGGVDSPHVARLFDGRRVKWDGAERAIREANTEYQRDIAEHAKKAEAKTK